MSDKKKIFIICIASIILIILFSLVYKNIISVTRANNIMSLEMENIAKENEEDVFSIQKVVLYSSAEYEDLSEEQNLQDVSIHQYTDLAIYISNNKDNDGSKRSFNTDYELTEENTIYELYIDDIKLETKSELGQKNINYKSPLDLGKYRNIDQSLERIDFKVIHENEENTNNYSSPVFFTDCSNPITLGMLNKNILEHCTASNEGTLALNGSILKNAGINLNDLKTKISFTIHLKNNLNEEFVCKVSIDNDLGDGANTIYDGFLMKVLSSEDLNLKFFKKP